MAELAFFLVFVFAMAWMIEAATAPAESADNVAEAPTPILVPVILPITSGGPAVGRQSGEPDVADDATGAVSNGAPAPAVATPLITMLSAQGHASCLFEFSDFEPPLTDTTRRTSTLRQSLPALPLIGNLHGSFLEDEHPFWTTQRSVGPPTLNPEARAVIWVHLDWNQPQRVEIRNNLRKDAPYVAYNSAGLIAAWRFLDSMGLAGADRVVLDGPAFKTTLARAKQHVRVTLDADAGTACELKRVVRIRNVPGISMEARITAFKDARARLNHEDADRYRQLDDLIQTIERTMNGA